MDLVLNVAFAREGGELRSEENVRGEYVQRVFCPFPVSANGRLSISLGRRGKPI